MADYSRNRTTVEDWLAFILAQLGTISNLDVRTYQHAEIREIYKYLVTIKPDNETVAAVCYPFVERKDEPQSIYCFYVYVISKDWGSLDNSLASAQSMIEQIYSVLDFQLYPVIPADPVLGSPSLFYAKRDDMEALSYYDNNSKNMVFRLTFMIEDH